MYDFERHNEGYRFVSYRIFERGHRDETIASCNDVRQAEKIIAALNRSVEDNRT